MTPAVDPNATSVHVQAIVRMADLQCQVAEAEIPIAAAPLPSGATITVRGGVVAVESLAPGYVLRLRDLDNRVNELRDRAFRVKRRLLPLNASIP